MKNIGHVWMRELRSLFFNPVGWLIALAVYWFRGLEVYGQVQKYEGLDVSAFVSEYTFSASNYLLLVMGPALLTMRSFAEEWRTGSMELLLTAPVRDVEVVAGKWLGALSFFALLWLPTVLILEVLTWGPYLDTPVPLAPVLTGYLGMFLLGALLLAIGCFTSSLTDNQLLSSLLAILLSMGLLLLPLFLGGGVRALALDHYWVELLYEKIHVGEGLAQWFARGLIDTSQVAFYLAGTACFLFLTVRSLGSRSWR